MALDGLCRFAVPVEKAVLLNEDGFLLTPSDPEWSSSDTVQPVPVTELPVGEASFALLAAGGAGKTVTFTELAKAESDGRRIDAAALTIDALERELDGACFNESAVYLDGLDQAASVETRFLPWLEQYVTAPARRGMRWRLACRAAAWDAALGQALFRTLPAFTVWKLAPLDRDSAEKAVECAIGSPDFDTARFMEALIEARLGRLSGCIGQLVAVARYWTTRGELPQRAADAMSFEIEYLLRETDSRRKPSLPLDRAVRIARRLGAFTMFAGTQALTVGPVGNPATLPVDELPSDAEPDQPVRTIEPADYREVLDTALFDSGPAGSVVFRHQRYLEYLAATYLVERGIKVAQIPALLGVHANGLLPTARIGVASWLAALAPDLVVQLFTDNAATFASSAAVVELPSDEARAALVKGLLEAAARDDAKPDWRLDRTGLLHAGLTEQLTEYLADGPANSLQLWWIARLAAAGGLRVMAPAMAQIALETSWFDYARRAAVAAVAELGDDPKLLALRELLMVPTEGDPDPDNEVRAAVIDALYPRLLTIDELTRALRPHRSILYGGYRQTLEALPGRIPGHDLAAFVIWLAEYTRRTDGHDDQFERLYAGVIEQAWRHAHDGAVRTGLAKLLVALVRSGRWHEPRFRPERIPWVDGESELRRAIAINVASACDETWYAVLTLGLLTSKDASWLLDMLPSVPPQAAGPLANCLPQLLHSPSAAVADRVLGLPPGHPGYQTTIYLRTGVAVDDESVLRQRRIAAEEHEYRQQLTSRQQRVQHELRIVLAGLDTGPESWWRIPWLLADKDIHEGTAADITQRPGWAQLSSDEKQLVITGGFLYLQTHQPTAQAWWTATSWNPELTLPDWSGIYLIMTLAEHFPTVLDRLPDDVWARWAASIVATPVFGGDDAIKPRHRALDAVPADVRPHLIDAALQHLDALSGTDASLTPHAVYVHLAMELSAGIAKRLLAALTGTGLAEELLTLLVRHGSPEIALDTCRRLIDSDSPLAQRARTHMAKLDPDSVIDALAAATASPEELAEAALFLNVTLLDPDRLVIAARLLLDSHPYATDPPFESGFRHTSHHQARDVRRHILERMALDGRSEELAALSYGRSDADKNALAYHYRIARARQADLSLGTTPPRALLRLLSRGDARLVRDDADLQHLLLQQLDELQGYLGSAWREIWDDGKPQTEDDISDWLERRLGERLNDLVIDREVQVRRDRPGIGTRIDLTATTKTTGNETARVLVEAKRIDNRELETAMQNQLINRYLVPKGRRHGIYLVYWIAPSQRPDGWSRTKAADVAALKRKLNEQVQHATEAGFQIAPYILDISRPENT
ncbi:hypothetical protein [Amycolatopsis orientalis]|uniref:hypothetical protein n=1 Tax=Amycolatopsis orientalis TaxID=31958 RepID=UPI001F42EC04|nr:hypothetical protein [Amycolatopsis orientalis]